MHGSRWIASAALALVATMATGAYAEAPVSGEARLDLHVGNTTSIDVGYAMGLRCDDTSVIRPELVGETPHNNRFFVTGLRPGTTLCRVGVHRGRPTVLVHIRVLPR